MDKPNGHAPGGDAAPATERTKRDLEREVLGQIAESQGERDPLPSDHKDRIARVLNLEALLEQHRPYTGDWFRIKEMLKEARGRLQGVDPTRS